MIKLLIVDDSAFARYSINRLVAGDPEIEVVGAAKDGLEAVALTEKLRPQVILLDIAMPGLGGLAAMALPKGGVSVEGAEIGPDAVVHPAGVEDHPLHLGRPQHGHLPLCQRVAGRKDLARIDRVA